MKNKTLDKYIWILGGGRMQHYNILAAKEANKRSSYEAILIENSYVTEGTASNVWIVKNSKLIDFLSHVF